MKKILTYILSIFLITSAITQTAFTDINADTSWPQGPSIYGECAVLIDASTGTVLYNKNMNKKMYPASITKIMTALLTIENCQLDETVTYSKNAIDILQYDDANIAAVPGEQMSVKDCLYSLMLYSANETATALGEHISGSTKDFAKLMTKRAKELGAKNTHFTNANGLHDPNHYVTAYDMAMITRGALKYDVFKDIVNSTAYTIPKNNKRKKSLSIYQRHKMVYPTAGYYYEGIIGGKTGYTDQSGTTLVTCAKRNGMTLISVVLKSSGTKVYSDTKDLLDFGFKNFKSYNISSNEKRFSSKSSDIKSPFDTTKEEIYIDSSSTLVIPKNVNFSSVKSDIKYELTDDSFATITYSLGNTVVGSASIKYKNLDNSTSTKVDTQPATTTISPETTLVETEASVESEDTDESTTDYSKLLTYAIIAVIVIIILFCSISYKRRLSKIRQMKRRRQR